MCRGTPSPAGSSVCRGLGVTAVPRRSSDASRYLTEYQDVDGCTEVSGQGGRANRRGGNGGKNLRRSTEPFCFPARGSLRPGLAQAHRSLRPHASTHGCRPRIPRIRTHPARLPSGSIAPSKPIASAFTAAPSRLVWVHLSHRASLARLRAEEGFRSSPHPSLQHPPRTHTPGTSRRISGMAAPGCRPHGPGAPPPARQMVNYIHSRILRWDRVSDNEPVLFD